MEIPIIILSICAIGMFILYSNQTEKIKHYESLIPKLLDEWEKLEAVLDEDSKSKLAKFKKMLLVTWKYSKFNDTHKN